MTHSPETTKPSRNPANSGDLAGALQEILGKFLSDIDDMLPAVVIAYDRNKNEASLRPLIRLLKTDGTLLNRAEVPSVPVFSLGGGNAVITFNLKAGDLGWIKASDRDISLFMEKMIDAAPNTLRKHNFSDAVFFPDQFKKWALNGEDAEASVFQTLDGSQRIALHDDKIKVTSDALVELDTPQLNVSGKTNLGSGGDPIGRIGDTVQVTILPGTITSTISGSTATGPTAPVVVEGVITGGSSNNTAN